MLKQCNSSLKHVENVDRKRFQQKNFLLPQLRYQVFLETQTIVFHHEKYYLLAWVVTNFMVTIRWMNRKVSQKPGFEKTSVNQPKNRKNALF